MYIYIYIFSFQIHQIQCIKCGTIQPVQNQCQNEACQITFAKYFCAKCLLFLSFQLSFSPYTSCMIVVVPILNLQAVFVLF